VALIVDRDANAHPIPIANMTSVNINQRLLFSKILDKPDFIRINQFLLLILSISIKLNESPVILFSE